MIYVYRCEKCDEIIEKEMSIAEDHPKSVVCDKCGGDAPRYWKDTSVHIPENFKATSPECDGNNPTNLSNLSYRMNHSRPSGKSRCYW